MQDCLPHFFISFLIYHVYDISLVKGVSEMFELFAAVFMLQIFFICEQINLSSLSLYFGLLFPKVSASLFVS